MSRIAVVLVCMLVFTASAFAEETVTVPSQIKEVTLFTEQALVRLDANTKVGSGLQKIALDVRAFNIDKDSVEAVVFGDGDIYSVQCMDINLPESATEQVKILEKKLEDLQKIQSSYNNEADVLRKKESYLSSVIDFAKVQVPQDMKTVFPKPEDLEKTLAFLGMNYANINKDKESLDEKTKALDKEIDVVQRDLNMVRSRSQKVKRTIEILFDSKKEQEVRIQASYLAYNAGWAPFYKIDVSSDLKNINLSMFAKITQVSGEDWKNVKLTLSNVTPFRAVELPSLSSWILDIFRPQRREMIRDKSDAFRAFGGIALAKRKDAMMEQAVSSANAPAYEEKAEFVEAESVELPTSFEYVFPQPVNIESQDKETMLPVFSKELKGDFYYYAVPKISLQSFLVCQATSAKEILRAPLSVYFGGRFVGKTLMSEKKPGEEFEINLGTDRDVVIKREKIKDKSQETFFGKIERLTIVREIGYKIAVENLKDKPVKLKLFDAIPVSKTDKIEVKDLKLSPEPTKRNHKDREGVMLWDLNLNPKESKNISIDFTLTYSKDTPLDF